MRIHRSYIVYLAALQELYRAGDGEYLVAVRGGRHLPVGPSYTALIRSAATRAATTRGRNLGNLRRADQATQLVAGRLQDGGCRTRSTNEHPPSHPARSIVPSLELRRERDEELSTERLVGPVGVR
jgi:hypothetical protein